MAIIKKTDIYNDEPIFKNLLNDLQKLNTEAALLAKTNAKLSASLQSVKKSSDGTEAKELVKITNQLNNSTNKLNLAETEQSKKLAAVKVEQQRLNKINKDSAILANEKISLYQRESTRLTGLRKKYKDLALQNKENTKEGKKLLANLQKLDAKLQKVDNSVGQNHRSVGKYSNALKGLKNGVAKIGVVFVGALAAIRSLKFGFDKLVDIIGATAEGEIFLAQVTGATNAVMSTFRDNIIDSFNELVEFGKSIESTSDLISKLGDGFVEFYSVRGKGFLKFITSITDVVKGDFKAGLTSINDGLIQMVTGTEDATKKTKEQIAEIRRMAAFGAAIAKSEKKLELDRAKFARREAKDRTLINELRIKGEQKDKFSAKERASFLQKAINLQKSLGAKKVELANAESSLQTALFNANKSNITEEIELEKVLLKSDEIRTQTTKKLIALESKLQTLKREALNLETPTPISTPTDNGGTGEIPIDFESENEQKIQSEISLQESLSGIRDQAMEDELERLQEQEDAKNEIKEAAWNSIVEIGTNIFNSFRDENNAAIQSAADAEISILKNKLDKGEISEKEFLEKKVKIEKKARYDKAKEDRKAALWAVVINTAVGIIKSIANLGLPAAIPAIIATVAIGALQAGVILANPLPKLADGEVNIQGKSHANGGINAEIEGGESVIKKSATANSENLLNMVNDGIITDDIFSKMTNQNIVSDNKLITSLLDKSNSINSKILMSMLNMGYSYDRNGVRNIIKADGSSIEKFNINE